MVTWRPVSPAGIKPAKHRIFRFVNYTKCRSTLLIPIWILAFCLCTAPFSCPTAWKQTVLWHWWFPCAVAGPASRDIDDQVTAWKFRCLFSHFLSPLDKALGETNVCAGRIELHIKFVIWHRSATKFRKSQGGMKASHLLHSGHEQEKAELQLKVNWLREIAHLGLANTWSTRDIRMQGSLPCCGGTFHCPTWLATQLPKTRSLLQRYPRQEGSSSSGAGLKLHCRTTAVLIIRNHKFS